MIKTAQFELSSQTASVAGQALTAGTGATATATVDQNNTVMDRLPTTDPVLEASDLVQNPEPDGPEKDKSQLQKLFASMTHYATVGALLRLFGSASMIIALGVFLLNGFHTGTHLQRFWLLLAFSAISVTTGVLMSRIFSDQKGARTMVTIALLSVPTCFAVLGALVYSLVPLDGLNYSYPEYLFWQAGNLSQLTLAGAACTLIAAVVSWFGFSVLAQQIRLPLFTSLMLSGALLVIPVRDSAWVALVGFVMIGIIATVLLRYVMPRLTLKTHWSSFSVLLTALPLAILVCRGAWLYDMSTAMMFASAAGLHGALLFIARGARNWPLALIESSLLVSGAIAVLFSQPLIEDLARSSLPIIASVASALKDSSTFLLLSALIIHLDLTLKSRFIARWSRILFSMVLLTLFLETQLWNSSPLVTLATTTAVAVLLCTYGVYRRYRSLVISGSMMIVALVLFKHEVIFELIYSTGILGILAFGTTCVFSAHLLEKYGPLLRARYSLKAKINNQDVQQQPDITS